MNNRTVFAIATVIAVVLMVLGIAPQVLAMTYYVVIGNLVYQVWRSENISWGETIALMVVLSIISLLGAIGTIYHAGVAWFIVASLVLAASIAVVKHFSEEY